MASANTHTCNNCSYTGEDLWIISAECEHRYCTKCAVDTVATCKTCRKVKAVVCLYEGSGCSGLFKRQRADLLENHLKTCDYRKVPCPNDCSEWLHKKDLVHHVGDLCPKRLLHCRHCKDNFFAEEMNRHLASCDYVPVKCEFCEKQTLRRDIHAHLKECPFVVWPCEFSTLGCDFRGTSEDLQKHLTLSSHAKLIIAHDRKSEEKIDMLSQQVNRLLQEVKLLKEDRKSSEERLQACEEKQMYLEEENKALRIEVMNAKRDTETLKDEIRSLNEKLRSSVIDQASVNEKDEAFRTKAAEEAKVVKNLADDLVRRLDALIESKEKERKKLASFCDNLHAELLPGLDAKKESTNGQDVLLSCFELVKDWATGMKQLQELIMSREDIDLINYREIQWHPSKGIRHQILFNELLNLGFEKVVLTSRTFVLDPNCKVTAKELNSPYESVKLVIRFRFIVRRDTSDVFAEVSHSNLSKVRVQLRKLPKRNVILETTLTDLQKRVNKVPIFCGCIQTAELSCNSLTDCYFNIYSC